MNIAILLRGQPRYGAAGAELFDKFVRQRFPQHDFKVFGATWNMVSSVMTDENLDHDGIVYGREFNQHALSKAEVLDELRPWKMERWDITNTRELFNTIVSTSNSNANDHALYSFIDQHIKTHNINPSDFDAKWLLLPCNSFGPEGFREPGYKQDIIQINYIMGQCYSFAKSYEVYNEYIQNNDYEPDLVLSMRYDGYFYITNPSYFEDALRYIDGWLNHNESYRGRSVFVNNVGIHKNKIWLDDFYFIMKPDSVKNFACGEEDNANAWIQKLLTYYKTEMMPLMSGCTTLQHSLWSLWGKTSYITSLHPSLYIDGGILRPSNNMSAIRESNGEALFKLMQKQSSEFIYPSPNTPPTIEMLDNTWQALLDN